MTRFHDPPRTHEDSHLASGDVALLSACLANDIHPSQHPALVILSGLPGSGKSYFARRVAQQAPIVVLETDAMRKQLVPRPTYGRQENDRLFQAAHELTSQVLAAHRSVLFDATNLSKLERGWLYRIGEEAQARLAVVRMQAPDKLIYQRLRRRQNQPDSHDLSDAGLVVYRRMKERVEPISRRHLVVDTSVDISPPLELVARWLSSPAPTLSSRLPGI